MGVHYSIDNYAGQSNYYYESNEQAVSYQDRTLFHYTSHEGLLGITASASIWATNLLYLNDASEFNYTKNLLVSEIRRFCENGAGFKTVTFPENVFFEYLQKNINELLPSKTFSFYVCSFSEEGDLLSQWRGYCKEGSGYSLGFAVNKLERCVEQFGFTIKQCIYEKKQQIDAMRELIGKASDRFDREVGNNGENWDTKGKSVLVDIIMEFTQLGLIFKHPKFKEEREWRIVASLQTNKVRNLIKLRRGHTMMVPYIEIPLNIEAESLVIDEVFVGPTNKRSSDSLKQLLKSRNVTCSRVKRSTIPYRMV